MTTNHDTDYMAYDGNAEQWVDLRECNDTELISWLDTARIASDDETSRVVIALLNERGVPGSWTYGYDDE